MKILYVGATGPGETAGMRMSHLRGLGHEVLPVDTSAVVEPGPVLRTLSRVAWRLGRPLDLADVNRRVLVAAQRMMPNLVWVDKGVVITRGTLLTLRRHCPEARLVHYNPDDPFGLGKQTGWGRFVEAMPLYDVHFVPRRENIQEYRDRGCPRVIHNVPTRGFDPDIHRPYPTSDPTVRAFAADVGFLGAYEEDRYRSLFALAEVGIAVTLMHPWPKRHWHRNFVRAPRDARAADYGKALSSFKIGLCFLRKANRDQHTSRSIEIPACGTFLLAERTEEHRMLFEEGKEAEFFSSDEDLIDKVRFYLGNDLAREGIAYAGRERCVQSGYDYTSRMRQMLQQAMASRQ